MSSYLMITTTIIAEWQKYTDFEHFLKGIKTLYIIAEWQKRTLFDQFPTSIYYSRMANTHTLFEHPLK